MDDPSDWAFGPLRGLDELLRCPICFEYYKTTVLLPGCSHSYCSLCIRRYLEQKQQCPTCSQPVQETDLKCNRLMDQVVKHFKASRGEFMTLVNSRDRSPSPARQVKPGLSNGDLSRDEQDSTNVGVEGKKINGVVEGDLRQQKRALLKRTVQRSERGGRFEKVEKVQRSGSGEEEGVERRRNGVISSKSSVHSKVFVTAEINPQACKEDIKSANSGSISPQAIERDTTPPAKRLRQSYVPEPPSQTFTLTDLETQESQMPATPATPSSKKVPPTNQVATPTIVNSGPPLQPIRSNRLRESESAKKSPSTQISQCNGGGVSSSATTPLSSRCPTPKRLNENSSSVREGADGVRPGNGSTPSSQAGKPSAPPVKVGPVLSQTGPPSTPPVNAQPASSHPPGSSGTPSSFANSSANRKVACPVCALELPQLLINSHLDLCLTGSLPAATPTCPSPSPCPPSATEKRTAPPAPRGAEYRPKRTLPPLPKVVFSIMTDKQLRKQIRQYGLMLQGDRTNMIARMKEFLLLYKAERDSLNPRTKYEIAQEVDKNYFEKATAKKNQSLLNASITQMPTSRRNASSSEIEAEMKSYEKSHSEQFAKLVSEVRQGRGRGRGKAQLNNSHTDPSPGATPPTGMRRNPPVAGTVSPARPVAAAIQILSEPSQNRTRKSQSSSMTRDKRGQGAEKRGQSSSMTRDRNGQGAEKNGQSSGAGNRSAVIGDVENGLSDDDILILAADSLNVFGDPADDPVRSRVDVSVYEAEDDLDCTMSTIPESPTPPSPSLLQTTPIQSPSLLRATPTILGATPPAVQDTTPTLTRTSLRRRKQFAADVSSSSASFSPLHTPTKPQQEVGMSPSSGEVSSGSTTPYRKRLRRQC